MHRAPLNRAVVPGCTPILLKLVDTKVIQRPTGKNAGKSRLYVCMVHTGPGQRGHSPKRPVPQPSGSSCNPYQLLLEFAGSIHFKEEPKRDHPGEHLQKVVGVLRHACVTSVTRRSILRLGPEGPTCYLAAISQPTETRGLRNCGFTTPLAGYALAAAAGVSRTGRMIRLCSSVCRRRTADFARFLWRTSGGAKSGRTGATAAAPLAELVKNRDILGWLFWHRCIFTCRSFLLTQSRPAPRPPEPMDPAVNCIPKPV